MRSSRGTLWPSLIPASPAISCPVKSRTSLAIVFPRKPERRGNEATGRRPPQPGRRRSVAGSARSQHLDRRGSAGGGGRGGPFTFVGGLVGAGGGYVHCR